MGPRRRLKSEDVRALLRRRYAAPEWALIEEVRNGTGYTKETRYADAIAMSVWPSRGLDIHGFEIKVSKQDWKNELRNPKKSAAIQKYCDRWWIVAPKGIVDPSELPPTWGLILATPQRLLISKDAPKLNPVALDRSFVASMLRNVHASVEAVARGQEAYERGKRDGMAEAAAAAPMAQQRLTMELDRLKREISSFERSSGLSIHRWSYGDLRTPLELLQSIAYGSKNPVDLLRQAREPLSTGIKTLEVLEQVVTMINDGRVSVPQKT